MGNSSMAPVWFASVENGQLFVLLRREFDDFVRTLKDGEYALSLKRVHPSRSIPQNNFYWMRNTYLGAKMGGVSKEGVHEVLMHRCGFHEQISLPDIDRETGEIKTDAKGAVIMRVDFVRWTSRDLDVQQFSELISEQDVVADFLEVRLPTIEEWNNRHTLEMPGQHSLAEQQELLEAKDGNGS